MKRITMFILFILLVIPAISQQKSKKQLRKERETAQSEIINDLLESKQFVFKATEALPMTGGSVTLNHQYDFAVDRDRAIAYLPFYGITYLADYGAMNEGGIKFDEAIKKYREKKGNKRRYISIEVKSREDTYKMNLSVSDLGYADLSVSCTRKQTMKFTGTIGPLKK